ncbi:exported hypothetical protein [Paraburkholderia ribeironis]|uniref:Uncharacterized protein n=2 Tax=Paraburkholderia ribeironis TaxID=1247936 RepID=A0A1N7RU92_9BURK|nr:exported hypothetical protein [Paraburkholderia ribeironis]
MFRRADCRYSKMKIPDNLSIAVALFVISASISALIIAFAQHA